jgi:3',5'-cyclic AMP phosphodiesterase CpdA
MSVRILHLTDLHLGPGELVAEDMKQKIPDAERGRLIDRLTSYLEVLPQPDFVVISGDLTNRGERQGIKDVHTWLSKLIKKGTLPGPDQILVVPGNHDVKWFVPEGPSWHSERYRDFFEIIGKAFPHSHLPGCDPQLDPSQPEFNASSEIVGGLCTENDMGDVALKSSYPFLLDLRREVLLFAFNSTLACGIYIHPAKGVDKQWDALLEMYRSSTDVHLQLTKLRDAYKDSLAIDAGMIGHEQLEYFSKLMQRMRQKLGSKYSRLTKIAVLHHHISHLWNQQLEVKSFESTIDAHEVKKRLVEFSFDLVLHGHKHTNHVGIDASVIPISSPQPRNPLCIIVARSVAIHRYSNAKRLNGLIFPATRARERMPALLKRHCLTLVTRLP